MGLLSLGVRLDTVLSWGMDLNGCGIVFISIPSLYLMKP